MTDPDWFMNILIWFIYSLLQGIVINYIGFFYAIFSDWDWGRITMVGLQESLSDNGSTWLVRAGTEINSGSYGAPALKEIEDKLI